jgi:hypothetical protein
MQAFGRNQTASVGHWCLFFCSKAARGGLVSRPAHFRKDTNAPPNASPQVTKMFFSELQIIPPLTDITCPVM